MQNEPVHLLSSKAEGNVVPDGVSFYFGAVATQFKAFLAIRFSYLDLNREKDSFRE